MKADGLSVMRRCVMRAFQSVSLEAAAIGFARVALGALGARWCWCEVGQWSRSFSIESPVRASVTSGDGCGSRSGCVDATEPMAGRIARVVAPSSSNRDAPGRGDVGLVLGLIGRTASCDGLQALFGAVFGSLFGSLFGCLRS